MMDQKLHGLSTQEAKDKQLQYGKNILPEQPPPRNLSLLIQQIKNPLIYVLLLAGLITLIIGHYPDTFIIALAVMVNTLLGFIQERKATNALHALKHYVANTVTVIRDGKRQTLNAVLLVPGDVVVLSQGVKVPADGKLVSANRFYLDESIVTGESASVKKDQGDPVFMGTTVASGQAVMEVESIGAKTKMGAIALQVQKAEEDTPLQIQLKGFGKQLLIVICILVAVVFIVGTLYRFN